MERKKLAKAIIYQAKKKQMRKFLFSRDPWCSKWGVRRPLFSKLIAPIFFLRPKKNYASYRSPNGGILKSVEWGYQNIHPFLKLVELSGSYDTYKVSVWTF